MASGLCFGTITCCSECRSHSTARRGRRGRKKESPLLTRLSLSLSLFLPTPHSLLDPRAFFFFRIFTVYTTIEPRFRVPSFPQRNRVLLILPLLGSLDKSPLGILPCSAMQGRPMMRGRHCITTFRSSCAPCSAPRRLEDYTKQNRESENLIDQQIASACVARATQQKRKEAQHVDIGLNHDWEEKKQGYAAVILGRDVAHWPRARIFSTSDAAVRVLLKK